MPEVFFYVYCILFFTVFSCIFAKNYDYLLAFVQLESSSSFVYDK